MNTLLPYNGSPPPEMVRQHVEAIRVSNAFKKSEIPKAILPYLVECVISRTHATIKEVAWEVFKNNDDRTLSKVKTAKKNLKARLVVYYRQEGEPERVRIMFPPHGITPSIQWAPPGSTDPMQTDSRFAGAAVQLIDDVLPFFKSLHRPFELTSMSSDVNTRLDVFREVFEPAYRELRSVHQDYLRMFLSARRAASKRPVDGEFVARLTSALAEHRLALESVRIELFFLFSHLRHMALTFPAAVEFVRSAWEYVAPPSRGTNASNLISDLNRAIIISASMTRADNLITRFRKLNVWKRGGHRAPHKPLLILLALGKIGKSGTSRMNRFDEISEPLARLLVEFGPQRQTNHPEYPFWAASGRRSVGSGSRGASHSAEKQLRSAQKRVVALPGCRRVSSGHLQGATNSPGDCAQYSQRTSLRAFSGFTTRDDRLCRRTGLE
jgi:hypothetical protein